MKIGNVKIEKTAALAVVTSVKGICCNEKFLNLMDRLFVLKIKKNLKIMLNKILK